MNHLETGHFQRFTIHNNQNYGSIALRCWDNGKQGSAIAYGGEILINSSFGAWAHRWNACGMPFKKFLADINFQYLFEKLMGHGLHYFDCDGTVRYVRNEVLKYRKSRDIDAKEAREIWTGIDDYVSCQRTSQNSFIQAMQSIAYEYDLPCLELSEPWHMAQIIDNPQAVGFWHDIWPLFIAKLKQELQ